MGYFLWELRRFHQGAPACLTVDQLFEFDSNSSALRSGYTSYLGMDKEYSVVYLLHSAKEIKTRTTRRTCGQT